jgi:predicted Zn-dependent protease
MRRSGTLESAVLSREAAQRLVEKIIGFSNAERVSVSVGSRHTANTRFAANQLSTAGAVRDVSIGVQSWFGPKHAVVTSNNLSDEGLRSAVETSETLARLAPDDPEDMPLLAPQTYASVDAYFDSTANLTPEDRARAAMTALEATRASGDLEAAGFLVNEAAAQAVANNEGLFGYHRYTAANYTLTVRTADGTGSGWAGADHKDWSKLDFAGVSARAIEKARASRNPVAIEPGRYTVILEPQAVGDLVQLFASAATARAADEGRSPFVKEGGGNKIGEKILDERVTLLSDPADSQLLARPFDGEGFPLRRQVWVKDGILNRLIYSRFWAKKQSKEPTGAPASMKMLGGSTPVDEMIASTERGVLVTRLWYLRQVDPRTLLYTGLTRDGTFLIEDGAVSKPIQNFRFNESPLSMLNNLDALGPAVRLAGTEIGGDVVMPTLKVRDFNFTSLSEAV